jgi:hypothetical protein
LFVCLFICSLPRCAGPSGECAISSTAPDLHFTKCHAGNHLGRVPLSPLPDDTPRSTWHARTTTHVYTHTRARTHAHTHTRMCVHQYTHTRTHVVVVHVNKSTHVSIRDGLFCRSEVATCATPKMQNFWLLWTPLKTQLCFARTTPRRHHPHARLTRCVHDDGTTASAHTDECTTPPRA